MASSAGRSHRLLCSKRLNLALLCFAGSAIAYALRSNLSFAIVCMVKEDGNGTAEAKSECAIADEAEVKVNVTNLNMDPLLVEMPPPPLGEFDWSKQIRGQVLGSVTPLI